MLTFSAIAAIVPAFARGDCYGGELLPKKKVFFFDTDEMAPAAPVAGAIKRFASAVARLPCVKMKVLGHAHASGDKIVDTTRSEERARNVMKLMTGAGVAPERVTTAGYGSQLPIGRDESQTLNNRVELEIEWKPEPKCLEQTADKFPFSAVKVAPDLKAAQPAEIVDVQFCEQPGGSSLQFGAVLVRPQRRQGEETFNDSTALRNFDSINGENYRLRVSRIEVPSSGKADDWSGTAFNVEKINEQRRVKRGTKFFNRFLLGIQPLHPEQPGVVRYAGSQFSCAKAICDELQALNEKPVAVVVECSVQDQGQPPRIEQILDKRPFIGTEEYPEHMLELGK